MFTWCLAYKIGYCCGNTFHSLRPRQRQRERDAAAQTSKQEAKAVNRLEEVFNAKYEDTVALVSNRVPLDT